MFTRHELRISNYSPHALMKPHAHDTDCLSLLVRGAFTERISGCERDYARGQIAFLPAGIVHSQAFGAAGARQIIFRPQPDWIEYLSDCKAPLADSPHTNAPLFYQLGDRLLEELARNDRYSMLACEGILLEIVAAFGRRGRAIPLRGRPPSWLSAVRDYVRQHAFEPIVLKDLARAAGRHEIHVAREFRRFFGTSVGEFARHLRTEEAARLLLKSKMSISEIALNCGFSSHSHFCREFKGRFGVTPSEYREE
jgi:AraC family transcriptional regulator